MTKPDIAEAVLPDESEAWRHEVRLRAVARTRPPFERHAKLVVFVVLAHVGVAVLLWQEHVEHRLDDARAVIVELLSTPPVPSTPPPTPSVPTSRAPTLSRAPAATRGVPSAIEPSMPTESAPPLQLFDRNGTVQLPSWKPFTTPLDSGLARGRELLARGHNILNCVRGSLERGTAQEAANAAGKSAHMAHLVMGNPLDPLNDVGANFAVDGAIQAAADKREMEMRACDGF